MPERTHRSKMTPAVLLLLFPALAVASYANNLVVFTDDQGKMHLVPMNRKYYDPRNRDLVEAAANRTQFFLYTRQNRLDPQELIADKPESIKQSYFNPKHPTRFVTHGWTGNKDATSCTMVRDAFLDAGDYNVIVIDWQKVAEMTYSYAVEGSTDVADRVAKFVGVLTKHGLKLSETMLIGHSLGAHVAGFSAHRVQGKVYAVVGLDPAGPSFSMPDYGPNDRIHESHAEHVQIIHTDIGQTGIAAPVGTSDFYPNKGHSQPGCSIDIIGSCSHPRSYIYYAESVKNPTGFRSTPANPPFDKYAYMGGPTLDPNARGVYNLTTNAKPPFAKG